MSVLVGSQADCQAQVPSFGHVRPPAIPSLRGGECDFFDDPTRGGLWLRLRARNKTSPDRAFKFVVSIYREKQTKKHLKSMFMLLRLRSRKLVYKVFDGVIPTFHKTQEHE